MDWKREIKWLSLITAAVLCAFYLPVGNVSFDNSVIEALHLVKWYAREHVVLCLLPAFFIAGAISVFISSAAVVKYLGPQASKLVAYCVAAVSGTVLAVCSCTVLPLFAGIYRMGAGLGPASAFLYAGPAVNVLAIILTARVLGIQLGLARAVGAIVFSVVVGLLMHLIFREGQSDKPPAHPPAPDSQPTMPLWKTAVYFATMIAILVFANWSRPGNETGLWAAIHSSKWIITAGCAVILAVVLIFWLGAAWWKMLIAALATIIAIAAFPTSPLIPFIVAIAALSAVIATDRPELREWFASSWSFAKQILPLLLAGVLAAGLLLGQPGGEGLIPSQWIAGAVGGNSLRANLSASLIGAFMYFATLTEVPILEGLIDNGMGKGPALALLLAGPAVSLPNMLVIRSVIGTTKTIVYLILVVTMATITGIIFGALVT